MHNQKSENTIENNHLERLKQNILKSDKERFLTTIRLIKIGIMLKNAHTTHQNISIKK